MPDLEIATKHSNGWKKPSRNAMARWFISRERLRSVTDSILETISRPIPATGKLFAALVCHPTRVRIRNLAERRYPELLPAGTGERPYRKPVKRTSNRPTQHSISKSEN